MGGVPRPAIGVHLRLDLDPEVRPIRRRVAEGVLAAIAAGRLHDGDALPSTRTVARTHGLPRSAVVEAYDELVGATILASRHGSGTVVSAGATHLVRHGARSGVRPPSPRQERRAATGSGASPTLDLRPGTPDTSLIRAAGWNRAWRAAIVPSGTSAPEEQGSGEALRLALVDHIRRFRGISTTPDRIGLHPTVRSAVTDLAHRGGLVGASVVMEDPGYPAAREGLRRSGADVRPVPVDDQGLLVARVRDTDAAVYVTPAHQYPTGSAMSLPRRVALVQWALDHDGLVIEDDYDGEFRYDADPVPALASLHGGGERVAYIGTSSKILTPELRIAWTVLPPHLASPAPSVERVRPLVSGFAVRALTHLLVHGEVGRHHARAMRTYAARRAMLIRHLRELAPLVEVTGVSAGLHVLARLPAFVDDAEVAAALGDSGYLVAPLSDYAVRPQPPGLVIGYAMLPESRARDFVRALASALP
jgi:GntR family transcriptional regulator/MocR family aminotransferase